MASSVSQPHHTSPTPNCSRPSKHPRQNQLQDNLNSFFNPEARDKREHQQRISQLYALQLQEAHGTIHRLETEINRLRDGINLQVVRLQDENTRLQATIDKLQSELVQAQRQITQLSMEKSNMQSRLDVMQLRLEFQQPGMFNSGVGGGAYWGGASRFPVHPVASTSMEPSTMNPNGAPVAGMPSGIPQAFACSPTHGMARSHGEDLPNP